MVMSKHHRKVIEIVPQEDRPIEDSANGKTNAFSHYCGSVMHSKNYAVCLHLIEERKQGRLNPQYADCSATIGKKVCPALAMRKEEIAAGKALYFVERIKNLGESFMDTVGELFTKIATPLVKETKSPVTKIDDNQPSMGGYSDAINNAIKKGVPTTPIKPAVVVAPVQGETLMEMAKRMMLANQ
jgi:Uri superfamily endonuclease